MKNWMIFGINVYIVYICRTCENILAETKVLTVVVFYVVGIILLLNPKGGTYAVIVTVYIE